MHQMEPRLLPAQDSALMPLLQKARVVDSKNMNAFLGNRRLADTNTVVASCICKFVPKSGGLSKYKRPIIESANWKEKSDFLFTYLKASWPCIAFQNLCLQIDIHCCFTSHDTGTAIALRLFESCKRRILTKSVAVLPPTRWSWALCMSNPISPVRHFI